MNSQVPHELPAASAEAHDARSLYDQAKQALDGAAR